jgi:hypothetical protein
VNVLIVQQLAWGSRIGPEIARVLAADGHRLSALVHGREVMEAIQRPSGVAYGAVYFADPLYDAGDTEVSEQQVAEIEERYGLGSLWRVAYCERWLVFTFLDSRRFTPRRPVTNRYILSVCWNTYRFVRDIVESVRPRCVLAPAVGSLANYFLYLECRRARIPFYSISFSRFGNHFYIADDLYLCSEAITRRFHELRGAPAVSSRFQEARRLHDAIRRNDPASRPSYLSRSRGRRRLAAGDVVARARDVALFPARVARAVARPRRVMAIERIWMPANSRWNAVRTAWVNLRERFVDTDHQGPCLTSVDQLTFPYVHFPLHVEPELSLLVFAPEHANQIELCRRIALGLPRGVRLLVKEHPLMVPARPRSFYDDLRGLPNVEIAHSSLSSHALVTHPRCRASLVVSSSVGFEAAMNGCPVVLLAPVQYSLLPGVRLAGTVEEAIAHLQEVAREPAVEPPGAEDGRLAYLCAMLENSFAFDYVERWASGQGRIDARGLVSAVYARLAEGEPTAGGSRVPVAVARTS